MCEAVTTFRQALAEKGLDGDVAHESNETGDTFYVSKTVAGETLTFTTSIDNYLGEHPIEKQIAMAANRVVNRFEELLTERLEWDGGAITVRPYDDPQATCRICGTTVELPEQVPIFSESAELSSPQPMPVQQKSVLGSLDNHSRVVLKMYLIGKLRRKCESDCRHTESKDL
jgi:hypothetical protein